MRKEYALYKGESLIASGSIAEIAKVQGVKPATISFYQSPTYQKRSANGMRLVLLNEGPVKICKVCNEEKSLSSFYKKENSKDGYQADCKSCVREAKKDRDFAAKKMFTPTAQYLEKMAWHNTLRILACTS